MKNILRIAQKGLVFNKMRTHILVSKYLSSKYLPAKLTNKLCLPGGQIDFGENPDSNLVREIKEETGILCKPSLPFYIWTWSYKKQENNKQIIGVARIGKYISGQVKPPIQNSNPETKLGLAIWIKLEDIEIDQFVIDEQPIIKNFIKYTKNNPFKNY